MNTENKKVKKSLIIQSFAPLFLLLTIKHLDICLFVRLIATFCSNFRTCWWNAILSAVMHPSFGSLVVSCIGACWIVYTVIVALGFKEMQTAGFNSAGETIVIDESSNDGGAAFLVTYVLPLITDDVSTLRSLSVFIIMLIMIIILLTNSNTFYQNPVLAALKYKTFTFKFCNPAADICPPERAYVGITHRNAITEKVVIKRKYIADGVFLIYIQ